MRRFLLVCLAGALGTGARYLIGLYAVRRFGTGFPVGTLAVNVIGCFLMGLIVQIAVATSMSTTARFALTTGFLGGLTTYSAFNQDTTQLLRDGANRVALLNVGATALGCLVAGLAGMLLARRLVP